MAEGVDPVHDTGHAWLVVLHRVVERVDDDEPRHSRNDGSCLLSGAGGRRPGDVVLLFWAVLLLNLRPGSRNSHKEVHPCEEVEDQGQIKLRSGTFVVLW